MLVTSMMVRRLLTCGDGPTVAVRAGGPGLRPGGSGRRRSLEMVNANLDNDWELFYVAYFLKPKLSITN